MYYWNWSKRFLVINRLGGTKYKWTTINKKAILSCDMFAEIECILKLKKENAITENELVLLKNYAFKK